MSRNKNSAAQSRWCCYIFRNIYAITCVRHTARHGAPNSISQLRVPDSTLSESLERLARTVRRTQVRRAAASRVRGARPVLCAISRNHVTPLRSSFATISSAPVVQVITCLRCTRSCVESKVRVRRSFAIFAFVQLYIRSTCEPRVTTLCVVSANRAYYVSNSREFYYKVRD